MVVPLSMRILFLPLLTSVMDLLQMNLMLLQEPIIFSMKKEQSSLFGLTKSLSTPILTVWHERMIFAFLSWHHHWSWMNMWKKSHSPAKIIRNLKELPLLVDGVTEYIAITYLMSSVLLMCPLLLMNPAKNALQINLIILINLKLPWFALEKSTVMLALEMVVGHWLVVVFNVALFLGDMAVVKDIPVSTPRPATTLTSSRQTVNICCFNVLCDEHISISTFNAHCMRCLQTNTHSLNKNT